MTSRSAEELAESATGDINSEHLTRTETSGILGGVHCYNSPLIEYLNKNEKLEYHLSHNGKGYRIIEPSGEERTPHHTATEGRRSLLVTDQRVLYVAGGESDDETIEHTYDELNAVDNKGMSAIRLQTNSNIIYKFFDPTGDVSKAADYVLTHISTIDRDINYSPIEKVKEVGVYLHSDSELSEKLSNLHYKEVFDRNKTINENLIRSDDVNVSYEFKLKEKVGLDNSRLLSDDGIVVNNMKIDYSDILDLWLLEKRKIDGSLTRLGRCDYIVLTVAQNSIESNQLLSEYNGDVYYLYLIGSPDNAYRNRSFDSSLLVSQDRLKSIFNEIQEKSPKTTPEIYILQTHINKTCKLKVEGWQESGGSSVNARIQGETSSTGSSRGVQVGPYTGSKSKSEGTVTAKLSGSISDKSFSSDVDFIHISEQGVYVDSDPVLDFDYDVVDMVLERDNGFTIEAGSTAYTITEGGSTFGPANLEEAIAFMQKQVRQSRDNGDTAEESGSKPADKLRELKEFHEEGILTDSEFESKKEDLLDDF